MTSPPRAIVLRTLAVFAMFGLMTAPFTRLRPYHEGGFDKALMTHADLDFAILGDSRPHAGVSPAIVREVLASDGLGERVGYNFATDGTDALHHVSFGRRLLERAGPRLRLIVWAPNPLSFDDTRRANRLELLTTADILPLTRAGAPNELLLDLVTDAGFPPYLKRSIVKEAVEGKASSMGDRLLPFQTKVLGLKFDRPPKGREYVQLPDGQEPFIVTADGEGRFDRGAAAYQIDYDRFQLGEWHLRYARELLSRARAAGILVVVLELPVAPSYRARFASTPKHAAWRERLSALAAEEGALWLSHADLYADDHAFGDPGHMHRETAADYSRQLGAVLAREPRVRAVFANADR